MRACWWWRATHSSLLILFMPLSTHTHTHTSLFFAKADLSFPHLRCALFCTLWIRALVSPINHLNWRWRTLIPSLYLLLYPPALFAVENGGGRRGGTQRAITFRSFKENLPVISQHFKNNLFYFIFLNIFFKNKGGASSVFRHSAALKNKLITAEELLQILHTQKKNKQQRCKTVTRALFRQLQRYRAVTCSLSK